MEQRSSVNSPCLDNSQTRYVSADHGFPPPHIIVAYKGRRRAYGRKAIKDMGYSNVLISILEQFDLSTELVDVGNTPPGVLKITNAQGKTTQCRLFALFFDTRGFGDRGYVPVVLNDDSWAELIDNILKLELASAHPESELSLQSSDITKVLGTRETVMSALALFILALAILIFVAAVRLLFLGAKSAPRS
ncbi:hypothetical protein SERLADRAFT_388791 [Serpula lacrymans var. lacrymans S7.9]|uniref:Uncharacterized protein n=1 Tax=Serpula lacrymans var. lacrymans (strain S7.9) TaxID=578457 RepID=F8NV40_SERL9|nr:uncharacterized protein SERLADRAFT_388791 [Serpula lacrymans var. lacrymans S7.9]EGO25995.1 hypothetical protein SERLADRAFT_388791 [Serpula lacrymans var. lacrymans S7.9]